MTLKIEDIKKHTGQFEGTFEHMYLDTEGYVTVAVGNKLESAADAQQLDFVVRHTRQKASAAQIAADFEAVSNQPKGLLASKYAAHTKLMLQSAVMDALFDRRIRAFESDLRRIYRGYDGFPYEVRLALLDLAYNLGSYALEHRWPSLNADIASCNWARAAGSCHRRGVPEDRNEWTKQQFESAARVTSQQSVGSGV